jgi:hypothetical protein
MSVVVVGRYVPVRPFIVSEARSPRSVAPNAGRPPRADGFVPAESSPGRESAVRSGREEEEAEPRTRVPWLTDASTGPGFGWHI